MKKVKLFILILCLSFEICFSQDTGVNTAFSNSTSQSTPSLKPRVLVFTKTLGYRHASIPFGISAIKQLGKENNFLVTSTVNAGYFRDDSLKKFAVVIFLSTTGDVLNQGQQLSFERFIRAGGGFVGIHSATDTEYDWPWYHKLVGAYFANHPKPQTATINNINKKHLSTFFLPENWKRFDEWYNFRNVQPDINILANLVETSYLGGTMGAKHPIAWYHSYDGGRSFYTAGGHTKESYTEPLFLRHLLGGIEYALGKNQSPVVKITTPANNAVYTAPANISINATASDSDGTIKSVRFYNGTTLLRTDSTSPYSFTWSKVVTGNYLLTAKATDNRARVTTSTSVRVSVVTNQRPAVSLTSPGNNAVFTAPATLNITASAKDPDGTIKYVKFYNATNLLKTDSIGPYIFSWKNVPAGYYSITAKATDNRGQTTTSAIVNISVVANKAPIVRVRSAISNASRKLPQASKQLRQLLKLGVDANSKIL